MSATKFPMMELHYVPIAVFWRALDLNKLERLKTIPECRAAVMNAEAELPFDDNAPAKIDPLSQAIAEYLSATGAFEFGKGEFGDIGGKFCFK